VLLSSSPKSYQLAHLASTILPLLLSLMCSGGRVMLQGAKS
jgi:hypothetical protein